MPVNIKEKFITGKHKLSDIRACLKSFLHSNHAPPFDEDRINDILLAVNECVANIIEHSYQKKSDKSFTVAAGVSGGKLEIIITDTGKPFDETTYSLPEFDGSKEGGFGIFIIKQITDQYSYKRLPGNLNQSRLIFEYKEKK